jgi:acetoin utilization protein AcuB
MEWHRYPLSRSRRNREENFEWFASYFADPDNFKAHRATDHGADLARSVLLMSLSDDWEVVMRVQDVMTDQVYKVSPETTAEDAWNVMRMRRIHHLVVAQGGRIVGLVSARDFGGIKGDHARELYKVADLMTRRVVTVSPKTPTRRAANVMRDHSTGCLAVVKEGRLVGIVTDADLLELTVPRPRGSRFNKSRPASHRRPSTLSDIAH